MTPPSRKLDRIDAFFAGGLLLIIIGIARWSIPAAIVTLGVIIVLGAILLADERRRGGPGS